MADPATFEDDVRPLMEKFRIHAMSLTKNHVDADDLMQDTLLRAYERYHLYRPGTNLRAWIMRIMTNLYINWYHKKRREPDLTSLNLLADQPYPHDYENVDNVLQAVDVSRVVKEALKRLPILYRDSILLVDVQGMKLNDAAKLLGVRPNTLKSRLYRGRNKLQRELWGLAQRKGIV